MSPFSSSALAGKQVLVTGATSGIGKATCAALHTCGASVILVGRDQSKLDATLDGLPAARKSGELIDFQSMDSAAAGLQAIAKKYGSLDGVFHSAGTSLIKPAKLINDEDVSGLFSASVLGALAIAKVFSKKACLNDGGAIVFMSSVASLAGQQGLTAYSSAKGAVNGLTRSLAVELAPRQVRVNALAAGAVVTEMHERLVGGSPDSVVQAYEDMHPLGFGCLDDISNLVIYLMSDAARWITGSIIAVDGGYSAR